MQSERQSGEETDPYAQYWHTPRITLYLGPGYIKIGSDKASYPRHGLLRWHRAYCRPDLSGLQAVPNVVMDHTPGCIRFQGKSLFLLPYVCPDENEKVQHSVPYKAVMEELSKWKGREDI